MQQRRQYILETRAVWNWNVILIFIQSGPDGWINGGEINTWKGVKIFNVAMNGMEWWWASLYALMFVTWQFEWRRQNLQKGCMCGLVETERDDDDDEESIEEITIIPILLC